MGMSCLLIHEVHLPHVDPRIGQQVDQFGQAHHHRVRSAHDGRRRVARVVLAHEARGEVEAHHLCPRGVDKLNERRETAAEGLAQPDAEERVDDDRAAAEGRSFKLLAHFREAQFRAFALQAFRLVAAFLAERALRVEEVSLHALRPHAVQQPGHGQAVAAVVARSGEDHEGRFGDVVLLGNEAHSPFGRTLHELRRADLLLLHGRSFERPHLARIEYVHHVWNGSCVWV